MMKLVMALFAFAALVAGVPSLQTELDTFFRSNLSTTAVLASSDVSLQDRPMSVEGHYMALEMCDETMTDPARFLFPDEARHRVARDCQSLARQVLDSAPSLSYAHLVRAQAALELADRGDLRSALLASENTGGDLAWLAQRRLDVLLGAFDDWNDELLALARRDVERLSRSEEGLQFMAQLYRDKEEARAFLTDAVEGLAPAMQRRFVSLVRRLLS